MRILMLSHGYPPTVSGVTIFVQNLARAMVERGHTVAVVTASEHGKPYRDEDGGVLLVRVRSTRNPFWREGPLPWPMRGVLDDIVEELQPEILHTHEAAFLAWQVIRLGRRAGLPILATCHFVPRFATRYISLGEKPPPSRPSSLVEKGMWTYTKWLFKRFPHVVFDSATQRDIFVEGGVRMPRTSVISCGVDTVRYFPADGRQEDVAARYGLPPRPRILFVSRLARDKEIEILIQAMPRICAEKETHLLLVGRGDDRQRLEALTEEMGLQDFVHFLGFVPEEDLPALYRASDLFAMASICEVLSIPTLQAMATALPVVLADAVALPELVDDGVNGFLVPPGDPEAMAEAILRVVQDPDLAKRMGQVSLSRAMPHAETRIFGLYEDLYQETTQATRPA
jgi:glycosyltransferase involved in cell wall biosynthesis